MGATQPTPLADASTNRIAGPGTPSLSRRTATPTSLLPNSRGEDHPPHITRPDSAACKHGEKSPPLLVVRLPFHRGCGDRPPVVVIPLSCPSPTMPRQSRCQRYGLISPPSSPFSGFAQFSPNSAVFQILFGIPTHLAVARLLSIGGTGAFPGRCPFCSSPEVGIPSLHCLDQFAWHTFNIHLIQ